MNTLENLVEIDFEESKIINGGSILASVVIAASLYSAACALAYGAGYLYGKIELAVEEIKNK